MNRLNDMEMYITPMWNQRFLEDQTKIDDYFHAHRTDITSDFCNYVANGILKDMCSLQATRKQDEIAYLVIHYLKSSLLNRGYDYEIVLCNKTLYLDEHSVTGYWYPEFLYCNAAEEELFFKEELQKKFVRVKAHEIEILRWKLFLHYWEIAKPYFEILVNYLLVSPEFKKVKTNGELRILYGEHMGKLVELEVEGNRRE